MSLCFVPIRDDKRLMNEAIPIDGREIFIKDLWQLTLSCCRNDEWPEHRKFLSKFSNIPRYMKLRCHDIDTNEYLLDLTGVRDQSTINNSNVVAPMYINGGKKENKVLPYDDDNKITFVLVEGSVLIFRPPLQCRKEKWMRNLEYRVVAADVVADADAADDVVVEEVEEVEVVVDADAADDVVEEEAEVVPVVDADDGDEEAVEEEEEEEEQLILPGKEDEVEFIVVEEEEEEIEELTVKSPSMLLQERQDRAEKSGLVVSLLDTPDKTTATVVVDEEEVEILPSFEEIRSIMGFSPVNNTSDPVPHDEDLIGWHSPPEVPRPNRRSIYDPIQIND